ncbi:MAG: bifunctional metallophosphatase/5'-nucleotidase, partial [Tenericutes bacterium]|nr:bifunctional metallophosphatase/5'-nucleotidase [Mycoplasmatota bacterium]
TKSSILLDLGDSIQGSPLMYFHKTNRNKYPNPVGTLLNYLKYDYFVPGNHDFNYGKKYLKDFVNQIKAKTLCQNIYLHDHLLFKNGYDVKVYKNGYKVLIIGATTKYIPNWENPTNIKNYEFRDPYEETKRIVDKFKDEVDLIILAYHGGFERDLKTGEKYVEDTGENQGYKLFNEIKDIDILLTGHQHREICEKFGNRVVMQPGFNGSNLGVIEIVIDNNKKLKTINPLLVNSNGLKEDIKCKKTLRRIERDNQKFLDEIIGIVPEDNLEIKDLFLARKNKHPIIDFINKIQLRETGAMLSATSLGNQVTGFKKEISIRNVLSTYVYANTLVVIEITGKILKEYLEKCAEYFVVTEGKITHNPSFSYPKNEHYNYDMIDGIDYVIDVRKEFGNRIASIKYHDKEIADSDLFTLALNNYRASGGGDFIMLKSLPVIKEIPLDVAELMIEYIRTHKTLKVHTKNNIKLLE